MCQLAAYVGDRPKAPLLLRAIELQEPYFGAHASGLGVIDGGEIRVEKDAGYVDRVRKTTRIESLDGSVGIAHSRWGHGFYDPRYNTKRMAHPFLDCNGSLCLMHNGNIANFKEHWQRLRVLHPFSSYEPGIDAITDSEVAVHMLEEAQDEGLTLGDGLKKIAPQLTGSFLLACISIEEPDTIWIANWYQPCVIGQGDNETMFCSSHIGFDEVREHFDRVFEPSKNSLMKLTPGKVEITRLDPSRTVPNLKLDKNLLGKLIIELLKKKDEVEFRDLRDELVPHGWAQSLGRSAEEVKSLIKDGISIVNPYIETLDMLIHEGKIKRRIKYRLEAGVEGTPRFGYSLN